MTVHDSHTRVLLEGSRPDIQVPITRVALTNGETFDRYSTEGPGSVPEQGLPPLRADWIAARKDDTNRSPDALRPQGDRHPGDGVRRPPGAL